MTTAVAPWPNPVAYVRARFQTWWQARLPLKDSITLTQRNVYILPTRPGFTLAATLMVLLVGSINYQLNLGYLLTFLLAGSAVVGMHVCHGTLRGLTMNLIAPDAQFAGASAVIGVNLLNDRKTVRYGIGLGALATQGEPYKERHWVWADVPALGSSTVHVAFKPERRGLHRVPTLTAETRFPLGTFRVWTVWRPAAQVLVYPAPDPHPPPLPPGEPRSGGAAAAQVHATGEYDSVRAYRRGDPLKLVVWKMRSKRSASSCGWILRTRAAQATRSSSSRACAHGCWRRTSAALTMGCACQAWRSNPAAVRRTKSAAWKHWPYADQAPQPAARQPRHALSAGGDRLGHPAAGQ
jgi:hypothetical protein